MSTADGDGKLAGKTAFITGAGSGMGRAMARRFAAEGATVAAADIDEGRACLDHALPLLRRYIEH